MQRTRSGASRLAAPGRPLAHGSRRSVGRHPRRQYPVGVVRRIPAHTLTFAQNCPRGEEMSERRRSASSAFVLRPGEGRDIDLGNFRMSLKASGDETEDAFSLLEADEPPNFGPPMHIHHNAAEAFYVVSGEYIIFLEDEEIACPAGSFIYIPAG